MFGKITEMKEKMETVKKGLDQIDVSGEAGEGKIKITMTANKKTKSVDIDPSLIAADKAEELEDLLIVAINRAVEAAETRAQDEIQSATKGMLPNIPGLGLG